MNTFICFPFQAFIIKWCYSLLVCNYLSIVQSYNCIICSSFYLFLLYLVNNKTTHAQLPPQNVHSVLTTRKHTQHTSINDQTTSNICMAHTNINFYFNLTSYYFRAGVFGNVLTSFMTQFVTFHEVSNSTHTYINTRVIHRTQQTINIKPTCLLTNKQVLSNFIIRISTLSFAAGAHNSLNTKILITFQWSHQRYLNENVMKSFIKQCSNKDRY